VLHRYISKFSPYNTTRFSPSKTYYPFCFFFPSSPQPTIPQPVPEAKTPTRKKKKEKKEAKIP
jgi:hypothetical protein